MKPIKSMVIAIALSILVLIILGTTVQAAPLSVHPDNPRYFTDGSGQAIYMTGSHNWDVLFDANTGFAEVEYLKFLDYMLDNNQNFLRLWTAAAVWECRDGSCRYRTPMIYQRTGPGTATDGLLKFNLTRYNPDYTKKLRAVIDAACDRSIYVSLMLFEGWWNADPKGRGNAWRGHPYNPLNNINGLDVTTGNLHTLDLPDVVALQEGYIRYIIDAVNDYEWFNPATGTVSGTGTITAVEGKRHFSLPPSIPADAVLYLKQIKF